MVIHLNRSEWLTAAAQAALAASRGAGSDCLTGIHMAADSRRMLLTLTATNHEIAIQASLRAVVEQPGQVVLNAALLPALLTRLPEEQVTLEQATASQVTIRSGTAVYVLSTPPAAQYPLPELPFPEDTVTVSSLHTLAHSTLFVTEKGSDQPLFQCVCLTLGPDGLTATGTNGFCIVEAEGDRNSRGSARLLLSAHALKILAAISLDSDVYQMGLAGAGTSVVFWNGTTLFSARLMAGQFPDTAGILRRFVPVSRARVDASQLTGAIRAAGSLTDQTCRIRLTAGRGVLLAGVQTQQEEAVTRIEAQTEVPGAVAYYYHYGKLCDFLARVRGRVTLEWDRQGLLRVRLAGTCYLQSPMRPPREAAQTNLAA